MSHIEKPAKAGGFSSLQSTMKQVLRSQKTRQNIKNLLRVNQTDGFDCPGCAWGDNDHGAFQFCENGAKAVAWESTGKTVGAAFFAAHSVRQLATQSDYWLEYQGRLTEPLRYNPATDHYEPISWDEAFSLMADTLKGLDSPDEVEFYTSGRASNEASYLYQLFGRLFGTNNFPDCSNMCHEASGVALTQSVGIGKGTVVLDDFDRAEAVFVYGQNPGTNHPRMMNALRKAARNGCKIVSFNNLKEVALERFASPQSPLELLTPAATTISHQYLTPKLGGDMAAIRGMAKYMLEEAPEVVDRDFIARNTRHFDEYEAQVRATGWVEIEQQSGLSHADIVQAARVFAVSRSVISCWAMGLTQHLHSVDTIREIVNLHLMRGQMGKPGAGLCPVRGHSNVQGNRTMGINEKPTAAFIERLERHLQVSLPRARGHNVYEALKALHEGKSKVLICLGGNLAAAAPDTDFTYGAMKRAALNIQISTKLNRSHLQVGKAALILPCLGRTELDIQRTGNQKITVEDTFSMVHASTGTAEPVSPLCLSETDIVARMAHATLGSERVDWLALRDDYGRIRDLIEQTIAGFTDFNTRIQQPCGFHLDNAAAQLTWNTASGSAEFRASTLPRSVLPECTRHAEQMSEQPVLLLQSLRSHDQYNTTIYGMDDRYRGIKGQRNVVFMNGADARRLGFAEGDRVDMAAICNDGRERIVTGFNVVIYEIPQGNIAAYYPETNPLVPIDSIGEGSYTPTSKSIPVLVTASRQQENLLLSK
ncbi:FdhF/YdeP family oxidoreductase [Aeromonas salmonicida]|uniref:Molybdopterin-dependent oxidoreductase alpha subunit n=1 Tax=Aeromonas salmonicida TaxID=645 RepID=A0AAX1PDI9_AERSA|nr:FdhF/YdeP family oxidoreductase [Aeromonas salmonicida]RAI98565.1 molybdopterin-dependent oxidoreductase alpha subunit [Aeromonas salmonicida]